MAAFSKQFTEEDYHDDFDLSSGILRYIDQILMEEDFDDGQSHLLQESADFKATERSFYKVLGQKYPHSPQQEPGDVNGQYGDHQRSHNNNNNNNSSFSFSDLNLRNGVDDDASKFLFPSGSNINYVVSNQNPKEGETCNKVDSKNKSNEVKIKKSGAKGKKPKKKKEVIDFASLLLDCAKSLASSDRVNTNELLRRIREHSSPVGDPNQRLAHYFADGLEARLAGTGSEIHKSLVYRRTTPSDIMRAFSTYTTSSPFGKTMYFAFTKSIAIKSEKAMRVHVIDFGILCGFVWPTLIQRLSEREGGPPKLKITGIDLPQPGFRPAERIETAGRWLARHAEALNVPFEFNAIAQKWETIEIEDLKIEKGEFVAVSCLCRSKNLVDEPVEFESSKNLFLDLVRKINPDIFIHGIVNAAYGDNFFLSRFRKALFHFSDLFDILETTLGREKPERLIIERDVFGKEVLNVIACEGWERVERPETYREWQSRHFRAGFMAVPFERKVMATIMNKMREFNVRHFVVFEENNWLLLSWKGRIMFAISCWQAAV